MTPIDPIATETTRRRYQRLSKFYDRMEAMQERRYLPWRKELWSLVNGPRLLEVGVGTGKNMEFYPLGLDISAIDLTPGMLERARLRAQALGRSVDLRLGDVQSLEFPDRSFDTAVATFVFCSVPNPLLGLKELNRVVRPGGQVLLLEHVRAASALVGLLMDLANPMVVRMMGANINRRTVENASNAGLQIESIHSLGPGGIYKLIQARVLA